MGADESKPVAGEGAPGSSRVGAASSSQPTRRTLNFGSMPPSSSPQTQSSDVHPLGVREEPASGDPGRVIVVNSGEQSTLAHPSLAQLHDVPTFLPVIRSSVRGPLTADITDSSVGTIDSRLLGALVSRLQRHMAESARITEKNQTAVQERIKQAEMVSVLISNLVGSEHHRRSLIAQQMADVQVIAAGLKRAETLAATVARQMERLNTELPEELRLESFHWRSVQ